MNKWHAENFSRIIEVFQKNVPLKAWRSWVSTMCVMTFSATMKHLGSQLCHVMITYPFSFKSYPLSMSESTFHCLIHHDFLYVYLSESHTFSLFLVYLFPYKQNHSDSFPWLHCFVISAIKIVWQWDLSSIVLPLIMHNSCWLMWDSLSPTFQQVSPHRPQHLIWDRD